MNSSSQIEHSGIVKEIVGNVVKVSIISQSACSACHAKGACSVSDKEEKIIDVETFSQEYKIGDEVKVFIAKNQGFTALFLGYVFPLILLLAVLFVVNAIIDNQGIAALAALGSLPLYYYILYLSRKFIGKKFNFQIEKIG